MKILFLDDDPSRHEMAREALHGHDVTHVKTAKEAIKQLFSHQFDVAMLDHDLGGEVMKPSNEESGFEVAKTIAEGDVHEPFLVIVHSWNPSGAKAMMEELFDANVNAVYAPFGPTSFKIAKDFGRK